MSLTLEAKAPPLRTDSSGAIRIGETRVLLELVIRAFQDGATPETIVQRYSSLSLGDIYSVIGYYLHHRSEVDEYVAHREKIAEEVQRKIQGSQSNLSQIRERLMARRNQ